MDLNCKKVNFVGGRWRVIWWSSKYKNSRWERAWDVSKAVSIGEPLATFSVS